MGSDWWTSGRKENVVVGDHGEYGVDVAALEGALPCYVESVNRGSRIGHGLLVGRGILRARIHWACSLTGCA